MALICAESLRFLLVVKSLRCLDWGRRVQGLINLSSRLRLGRVTTRVTFICLHLIKDTFITWEEHKGTSQLIPDQPQWHSFAMNRSDFFIQRDCNYSSDSHFFTPLRVTTSTHAAVLDVGSCSSCMCCLKWKTGRTRSNGRLWLSISDRWGYACCLRQTGDCPWCNYHAAWQTDKPTPLWVHSVWQNVSPHCHLCIAKNTSVCPSAFVHCPNFSIVKHSYLSLLNHLTNKVLLLIGWVTFETMGESLLYPRIFIFYFKGVLYSWQNGLLRKLDCLCNRKVEKC